MVQLGEMFASNAILREHRGLVEVAEATVLVPTGVQGRPSLDERIGLHVYTQQSPLYIILNERLRTADRTVLEPYKPLIKLLLTGLYRLPQVATTVYRGVKDDLHADYVCDTEVVCAKASD